MNNKLLRVTIVCFILAFIIDLIILEGFSSYKINDYSENELVEIDTVDIEKFQQMNICGRDLGAIKDYCKRERQDFSDLLARVMAYHDYEIDALEYNLDQKCYGKKNKALESLYYMVFDDIEVFPVKCDDKMRYYYCNSFLAPRNYGGERKHMGTDIIDGQDVEGELEIVSMTDGIVERLGWLELGGYRIGIRSESGAYFYYAHLDRYVEGLSEGDKVTAGQLIGYMGSTGYGEEGTRGEFVVHLHFGILLELGEEEVWVNPYPILDMIENY